MQTKESAFFGKLKLVMNNTLDNDTVNAEFVEPNYDLNSCIW